MKSRSKNPKPSAEDKYYLATQWQLMWQKFRRHKLALIGGSILIALYLIALFADFLAPYSPVTRFEHNYQPPTSIHIIGADGKPTRPFIHGISGSRDPVTLKMVFTEDKSQNIPIRFFVKGAPYKFLWLVKTDIHLFGVEAPAGIFLFGVDGMGRDLFSRILHGSRLSLSIGLVGVFITFIIGVTLGGISGYFGGAIDTVIQRVIEFLMGVPTLPFWIVLSAALPRKWGIVQVYFAIVVLLALVGWGGLARVVRGKFLELRELDYVLAARVSGVSEGTIIRVHLLPNFASYLIVSLTLSIPGMILGESSLSFLGLGLRSPAISWGVLLNDAMNVAAVAMYWWLIIPAFFVVITVLAFNFLGDGLRDAADPYKQ